MQTSLGALWQVLASCHGALREQVLASTLDDAEAATQHAGDGLTTAQQVPPGCISAMLLSCACTAEVSA